MEPTASSPALSDPLPAGDLHGTGEQGRRESEPGLELRGREMPLQVFLGRPVLVEQEGRGGVEGSVQVVVDAASFRTGGSKQVDELLLHALLALGLRMNPRDYRYLFSGQLPTSPHQLAIDRPLKRLCCACVVRAPSLTQFVHDPRPHLDGTILAELELCSPCPDGKPNRCDARNGPP